MDDELREQVRAAAGRADVRDAVRALYARVQAKVDERKPVCVVSGRCCRFEEYGHRLYVTTIELAVFQHELKLTASPPVGTPGKGSGEGGFELGGALEILNHPHPDPLPRVRGRGNQRESEPGVCPFQNGKLCGVHTIRPFGCRMFYCDPTAEQWQQEQYEQFHAELKRLHEQFGVGYFYVEWRQALRILGVAPTDGG